MMASEIEARLKERHELRKAALEEEKKRESQRSFRRGDIRLF